MIRKTCKVNGCRARAWQRELCNLHALEQYRSPRRQTPRSERLAEGKQLLRERARELGITLAENPDSRRAASRPELVLVGGRGALAKARSPVG